MKFVYIIKNTINNKRYVGKTTQKLIRRLNQHITDSYNKFTNHYECVFHNAIRKYGSQNFELEYIYEFNQEISGDQLGECEKYYINYYRTFIRFNDCKGYNMTLGGDGGTRPGIKIDIYDMKYNFVKTYDSIQELANELNVTSGYISLTLIKQKNRNQSFKIYDRFITYHNEACLPYFDNKSKDVDMYDLNGNFITMFESLKDAADFVGVKRESISACCRLKTIQCQGYIFRYHGDSFTKIQNKRCCKIDLYDYHTGEFIKTYDSILQLSNYLNVSPNLIQTRLKSGNCLADNFLITRNTSKNDDIV